MSRPVLKATTALTLTLSLLQPGPGFSQSLILRQGVGGLPTEVFAPETLWRVQDCASDPTLEGCPPIGEETPAPEAVEPPPPGRGSAGG